MKIVEAAAALNSGPSLWLIPDLGHSSWTHRLDWYLGFQIRRAQSHQAAHLNSQLKSVLSENHFPEAWPKATSEVPREAPLMIASALSLPNRQTVMIPYRGQLKLWAQECHHVWQGLKSPTVRVFLPKGVAADEFESSWMKQPSAQTDLTIDPELVIDIALEKTYVVPSGVAAMS